MTGDDRFLFRFCGRGEIDSVLEGRPWYFDKYVSLLDEVTGTDKRSRKVLDSTVFGSACVYDLPIPAGRVQTTRRLNSQAERVLQVSQGRSGTFGGRFIQVQIEMKVN